MSQTTKTGSGIDVGNGLGCKAEDKRETQESVGRSQCLPLSHTEEFQDLGALCSPHQVRYILGHLRLRGLQSLKEIPAVLLLKYLVMCTDTAGRPWPTPRRKTSELNSAGLTCQGTKLGRTQISIQLCGLFGKRCGLFGKRSRWTLSFFGCFGGGLM